MEFFLPWPQKKVIGRIKSVSSRRSSSVLGLSAGREKLPRFELAASFFASSETGQSSESRRDEIQWFWLAANVSKETPFE